jgi:Ca2+-binding RTX toxin-like protein
MADYDGTTGDDTLAGTDADDTFNLLQGGKDIASGDQGNDVFSLGGTLTSEDILDGGAGYDTILLDGAYWEATKFIASDSTIIGIEAIQLAAGNNYSLKVSNGSVAFGQTLRIDGAALGPADRLFFNGSAEHDGKFVVLGGYGNDKLIGGSRADTFVLTNGGYDNISGGAGSDVIKGARSITALDVIDGGEGNDTLYFNGNYTKSHAIALSQSEIVSVEMLAFKGQHTYDVQFAANSASSITIDGGALGEAGRLLFHGTGDSFHIIGGAGDDQVSTTGRGFFDLSKGGDDIAIAESGGSAFSFGGAFTASDRIQGGEPISKFDINGVLLDGDYWGPKAVVLDSETLQGIQQIEFSYRFSYDITMDDANVARGETMRIFAAEVQSGNRLWFDGSDEKDGHFIVDASSGDDQLIGGARSDTFVLYSPEENEADDWGVDAVDGGKGNDVFVLGNTLTAADFVNGGDGADVMTLSGDYSGDRALTIGSGTLGSIEKISFTNRGSYEIATDGSLLGLNQNLVIDAFNLDKTSSVRFDAHLEQIGHFTFESGRGADTFIGGAMSDVFVVRAKASNDKHYDTFGNFDFSNDRIHLHGLHSRATAIDASVRVDHLNPGKHFADEMAAAVGSDLDVNHALLVQVSSGAFAGEAFLIVDTNGTAGYQSHADIVVLLTDAVGTLSSSNFV